MPPTTVAAEGVFTPGGDAAERYNDPAPVFVRSALADRIVATVARVCARNHKPLPAFDGRLSAVADDLALTVGNGPPARDVVDFSLSHHGIIEPSPRVIWFTVAPGEEAGVDGELETRVPELLAQASIARVGVGVAAASGGSQTVVLALQDSAIETDPIPRSLPRGGSFRLRGRVLPPFSRPSLYVTRQDGKVDSPPMVRDGKTGFRADVRCGSAVGVVKVEIVAEDRPDNPADLANFPVHCGEEAPRSLTLSPDEARDESNADSAERTIFALANRDRVRAGLGPLEWDDRAASIARKHSADMRDGQYVAHVSPTKGTLGERARAGGLAAPFILENLARALSPTEAEDGLMASPGHRENLLSPQATHLGVGVAVGGEVAGRHELYVTQIFFRRPPVADRRTVRAEALAVFAAARKKARLAALVEDGELDAIAEAHASALAAGTSRENASAATEAALDGVTARFGRVLTIVGVTGDPARSVPDGVVERGMRSVGFGVAQGRDKEFGEGAYFMVILLATPR